MAQEQKEKLHGDLNTLLEDQYNQLKKKKDQHATEVPFMKSLLYANVIMAFLEIPPWRAAL